MTDDALADRLAEIVLGWKAKAERYQTPDRRSLPRWRFQPSRRIESALMLLDAAKPEQYTMARQRGGIFYASVTLAGTRGECRSRCLPAAVVRALARALQIEKKGQM